MPQRNKLILGFLALFLLFCCGLFSLAALFGDTETAAATPQINAATENAVAALPASTSEPTAAPVPTDQPTLTAVPTLTAMPTLTAAPTHTPTATPTSPPTNTPAPTNTPTTTPSPTATPTPIIIEGVGDAVVDVDRDDSPSLIHITGNAASRHFAVVSYGRDGQRIGLLVNTTSPYDGRQPLDFMVGEHATRFEVSATGAWTIAILPLTETHRLNVPGSIQGSGDDVIFLLGASPDLATISGNASSRHFAVKGYGGGRPTLLVNTTDPYQGTVRLGADIIALEIMATGAWTIDITGR